jgi:hypothetical protein
MLKIKSFMLESEAVVGEIRVFSTPWVGAGSEPARTNPPVRLIHHCHHSVGVCDPVGSLTTFVDGRPHSWNICIPIFTLD